MKQVTNSQEEKIHFLNFLRTTAVLFVFWDHLVGNWLNDRNETWFLFTFIQEYITKPLAIIQEFGYIGVVIFFLISGYIITYVAQRETRYTFIVKRFFRIFPPFFASVLIIVVFNKIYGYLNNTETFIDHISIGQIFFSSTLLNFFSAKHSTAVNGVSWTLVIEFLFYLLCFSILPLIRKYPRIAILSITTIVFIVLIFSREFGENFLMFSASMSYIPYLILGQILYYFKAKRIKLYEFLFFSLLNYFLIIYWIKEVYKIFYEPSNSYGVSFMYAYFIFVIAMLLNNKMKDNKVIGYFSNTSYAIYLNHGTFGHIFIALLFPYTGFGVAFALTSIFIFVFCFYFWKYVEEPSRKFARVIIRTKK